MPIGNKALRLCIGLLVAGPLLGAADCELSEDLTGDISFEEAKLTLYDSSTSEGGENEDAWVNSACVGDFDGDGDRETAVQRGNIPGNVGGVTISDSMSGEHDLATYGTYLGASHAVTLACPGDVNGDGRDDLLVFSDRPWLYLGRENLDDMQWDVEFKNLTGAQSGLDTHLSRLGDINGDGIDDLQFMDISFNGDYDEQGAIFVFYGGSYLEDVDLVSADNVDIVYIGSFEKDRLGFYPTYGGDVNGDGRDDVVLINGNTASIDVNSFPGMYTYERHAGELNFAGGDEGMYPHSLTVADFNGNGSADVAVGFWYNDYDTDDIFERIFVWMDVPAEGDFTVSGADISMPPTKIDPMVRLEDGRWLRYSTLRADEVSQVVQVSVDSDEVHSGDINGDGYDDLLTQSRPEVNLFYGAPSWEPILFSPDASFSGDGATDFLSVSPWGDITICTPNTGKNACYGF